MCHFVPRKLSVSDEQQQEYLQRRREAAENARRINADLGMKNGLLLVTPLHVSREKLTASVTLLSSFPGRGPDVSVAFAVCDDGDMNHAQRVREEAERRKRQEQQDREAALEQARREVRGRCWPLWLLLAFEYLTLAKHASSFYVFFPWLWA